MPGRLCLATPDIRYSPLDKKCISEMFIGVFALERQKR